MHQHIINLKVTCFKHSNYVCKGCNLDLIHLAKYLSFQESRDCVIRLRKRAAAGSQLNLDKLAWDENDNCIETGLLI